ncbi:hypothetical protein [Beijerinckia indica]|uniref:Uncharacterized protein n=1 Tax=Beijerinckia indica subsp. indica (strain ATCC 9039 / DSM 1715 / NCIMB 8712) TaxID=395963 RepID=B2IL58_BEII9|nr:hypothetical protein [Beijerinckia indica]ACB97258.1 hypothetical protein Bind_3706 [Beijerinckia indica subsp. indica ATCC 9039]
MYKATFCFISIAFISTIVSNAIALTAVKPVTELKCMLLNLPDEVIRAYEGLPSEYAEAKENSKEIGKAEKFVFVYRTQTETNGFLKVVRSDWTQGWIKVDLLKEYQAPSPRSKHCIPSKMSDGSLGFRLDP